MNRVTISMSIRKRSNRHAAGLGRYLSCDLRWCASLAAAIRIDRTPQLPIARCTQKTHRAASSGLSTGKNIVGRLGPILARSIADETTEAAAMKVENMMNREVKTCHPQDHLNQGAQVMWENTCGAVPIVDQQRCPVGFLTDRDICMAAYTQGKPLQDLSVEGAMSHRVVACHADDDLSAAMRTMAETGLRRLPVIGNDGTLIGILSLDDIACEAGRTMRGGVNLELRTQVADITIAVCRGRVKARAPIKPD
jgi:CBS domain-containing protein